MHSFQQLQLGGYNSWIVVSTGSLILGENIIQCTVPLWPRSTSMLMEPHLSCLSAEQATSSSRTYEPVKPVAPNNTMEYNLGIACSTITNRAKYCVCHWRSWPDMLRNPIIKSDDLDRIRLDSGKYFDRIDQASITSCASNGVCNYAFEHCAPESTGLGNPDNGILYRSSWL